MEKDCIQRNEERTLKTAADGFGLLLTGIVVMAIILTLVWYVINDIEKDDEWRNMERYERYC